MRYSTATVLALLSATSLAVPLNINLGAYSPALVVGDGEISFGGAETAAATLATLGAPTTAGTGIEAAAAEGAAPASGVKINPAAKEKRDLNASEIEKRDIAGFTAALNFAASSLTNSPVIELGTGEGGSGVGITILPVAAAAKAAGAAAKRDLEDGEEKRSLPTVTLMRVRTVKSEAGVAKRRALRETTARDVLQVDNENVDEVNLNIDGDVEFTIAEVKP